MIFVMKPTWKTGLASSMWPKWPGHSVMLPKRQQLNKYTMHNRRSFKCLKLTKNKYYATENKNRIYEYTCTRLASAWPLNYPLPGVHESPQFRASSLCGLRVLDAPFSDGHSFLKREWKWHFNNSDETLVKNKHSLITFKKHKNKSRFKISNFRCKM